MPMNVTDLLTQHARNRPGHPALIGPERVLTYRDLHLAVLGAAMRLRAAGVGPGDLVALALGNTLAHPVLFFAIARLGAAVQPIHHLTSPPEMARQARSFGAKLVIVEERQPLPPDVPAMVVDPAWLDARLTPPVAGDFPADDSLPILLALSSGTTNLPKGPLLTHRQFWQRTLTNIATARIGPFERYLSVISPHFSGGRALMTTTLLCGGTAVVPPPTETAEALVAAAAEHHITLMYLVPTLLRALLAFKSPRFPLFPSLRALLSSGSLIRPEERHAIRERLSPHFHEVYATSEAGIVSALSPEQQIEFPDSVGQPAFGIDVEIADDDHRPVAAPGTIGQLRFRGACVPDSFYRNPEASAAAFHDGWYYPGDLAAMNELGFIFLKGRVDDLIDRDGVKIRPAEIEAVLLESPMVAEAAVVGVPAENERTEVVAVVVLAAPGDERDLLRFCTSRLAAPVRPVRVFAIQQMPKTAIGKIDKVKLRSMVVARR